MSIRYEYCSDTTNHTIECFCNQDPLPAHKRQKLIDLMIDFRNKRLGNFNRDTWDWFNTQLIKQNLSVVPKSFLLFNINEFINEISTNPNQYCPGIRQSTIDCIIETYLEPIQNLLLN